MTQAKQKETCTTWGIGISTYPVVVPSVVESFMYGNVDCNLAYSKTTCVVDDYHIQSGISR